MIQSSRSCLTVILGWCALYLLATDAASNELLRSSRIRSRPVVLNYRSDVSLTNDARTQYSAPPPEISSETREILQAARQPRLQSDPPVQKVTEIQNKETVAKEVRITPRRRKPAMVQPEVQPIHADQPAYMPTIARVPGLNSVLAKEDAFLPFETGPSFPDMATRKPDITSAVLSDIRNAVQPVRQLPVQEVAAAAQAKSNVDLLGLTQQVLNPVLKKFLPASQSASSTNPFSGRGLLDILNGLGQKTSGTMSSVSSVPVRGPPVAGLPALPGLTSLPNSQSSVDIMGILSNIGKKIMQKSNLTSLMQAESLQKMADNITDSLVPDMPDVNLELLMGRWFEGINSPRATEERCIVHHYGGLTQNGKTATYTSLKIYREGSDFGQVRYSIGYAFRGGRQPGMLQMHDSDSSDAQPFWIYKVGPVEKDSFGNNRYEYAVVSNWIRYPLTVLVRDPDTFKKKYEDEVLQWLEKNNFINGLVRAFNLVQPVRYENCRYSENAFEVFG